MGGRFLNTSADRLVLMDCFKTTSVVVVVVVVVVESVVWSCYSEREGYSHGVVFLVPFCFHHLKSIHIFFNFLVSVESRIDKAKRAWEASTVQFN